MRSPQSSVGIKKDRHRPEEDVLHRVAAAFEPGVREPTSSAEVTALSSPLEMIRTVVLRQSVGSDDPEVRSRHEVALLVEYDVLGLDRHLARLVEHPEQALVDRLGPPVHQGDRPPEQG
jgi:hypothetical protein